MFLYSHKSNRKRSGSSKNGRVQPNRSAQALTGFHMSRLGVLKVVKQKQLRKIVQREHKLRNGRVANILVKREPGVGLLKTPWSTLKKQLAADVVSKSNPSVSADPLRIDAEEDENVDGAPKRKITKRARKGSGRKSNAEVAKGVRFALKKLKK